MPHTNPEKQRLAKRAWYLKNKDKVRQQTKAQRTRNQEFVRSFLSEHPCVDCGESDIVVLEFDHQRDKTQEVCELARNGVSLQTLKNEIEKCDVVCANCHKRRTYQKSHRMRGEFV
jgi:hypothetical protein